MDIQFRGKSIKDNKWIYGMPVVSIIDGISSIDTIQNFEDGCFHKCYYDTITQFIGRRDKNNKDIYEGDTVEYEDKCNGIWELMCGSTVVFDEVEGIFCFEDDSPNSLNCYRNLNIVGNIFDIK